MASPSITGLDDMYPSSFLYWGVYADPCAKAPLVCFHSSEDNPKAVFCCELNERFGVSSCSTQQWRMVKGCHLSRERSWCPLCVTTRTPSEDRLFQRCTVYWMGSRAEAISVQAGRPKMPCAPPPCCLTSAGGGWSRLPLRGPGQHGAREVEDTPKADVH